jgi:cytochrome c-type biogenesis protein CcmH
MRTALAAALLALAAPALAEENQPLNDFLVQQIGTPALAPVSGAALDQRTSQVASQIRCPVCQGSSIDESPSSMAQNMKNQTRELVSKGYSEEQIVRYFEMAYGEFIREKPKAEGINLMLWAMPALVALGGALGIALFLKSGKRADASEGAGPVPDRDTLPEDPALAAAVLRVRELAYGWPKGARPAPSTAGRS